MKNAIKKIFIGVIATMFACIVLTANAASNNFTPPVLSDAGVWATEENLDSVRSGITSGALAFGNPTKLVDDYVPAEAKVGLAFMNSLSHVAISLQRTLSPFILGFILIMFIFWFCFEIYNSINGDNNVNKLLSSLAKKTAIVIIWLIILQAGPVELFSTLISPIMSIGTTLSDVILEVSTSVAGIALPDTCTAIHTYATANITNTNILSPDMAANILCVPTRLSGFCYTMVAAGWELIAGESNGIGNAITDTLTGIALIIIFIYVAWKFAFVALGVVLDLFLGIIMLPFTALAETIGTTSLNYIPGQVYNAFTKVFKPESLQDQINRLVNALMYFVSLSIVIGFCTALVSAVFIRTNNGTISLEQPGFWISVTVALLVYHFATKSEEIAKNLGGQINDSMGTALRQYTQNVAKGTWKTGKEFWKFVRGK